MPKKESLDDEALFTSLGPNHLQLLMAELYQDISVKSNCSNTSFGTLT